MNTALESLQFARPLYCDEGQARNGAFQIAQPFIHSGIERFSKPLDEQGNLGTVEKSEKDQDNVPEPKVRITFGWRMLPAQSENWCKILRHLTVNPTHLTELN